MSTHAWSEPDERGREYCARCGQERAKIGGDGGGHIVRFWSEGRERRCVVREGVPDTPCSPSLRIHGA